MSVGTATVLALLFGTGIVYFMKKGNTRKKNTRTEYIFLENGESYKVTAYLRGEEEKHDKGLTFLSACIKYVELRAGLAESTL